VIIDEGIGAGLVTEAVHIVRAVYAALCSADPDTISSVAAEYFDDDIVVREAESLPWGGVYRGRHPVTALMTNIGDPQSPIDAAHLSVDQLIATADPTSDVDQVIAAVSFPWRGPSQPPVSMRALEWFTVRGNKVVEIQIYLWDTAAALAALQPADAPARASI
jgi:ketosteroid isomerase-like protein